MQVAFISDLHSNLSALQSVIAHARGRGVDKIICLGDIVDMGPSPGAVVDLLREEQILCIQGNHDTLDESPELPFLRDVEAWTREVLSAEQKAWLDNLPFSHRFDLNGKQVFCVHGSPDNNTQGLVAETPASELDDWLKKAEASVLVAGHTHVPMLRYVASGLVVNAGSTSSPFAEAFVIPPTVLKYSDYAILKNDAAGLSAELLRLPLDMEALSLSVREADMPHGESFLNGFIE